MDPKGLQAIQSNGEGNDTGSSETTQITTLYHRWVETERLLAAGLSEPTEASTLRAVEPGDESGATRHDVSEIADEQLRLLTSIIHAPSTSLDDVKKKLLVWRDLIAPDGQDEEWLQPSDQLVLSALRDLIIS